jgi:hypothetical protein
MSLTGVFLMSGEGIVLVRDGDGLRVVGKVRVKLR